MLNPFALFLYLQPVMDDLSHNNFRKVMLKATVVSTVVLMAILFAGDFIFERILQIDFESFRIFGGIIIFSFAYLFIVKGQRALIHMKEDLDDLASEIALPFMVGAGTISLTIVMGYQFPALQGLFALVLVLALNYGFIMALKMLRDSLHKEKFKIAFDKNMGILLRVVGFFIGAIGVSMVVRGLRTLLL